MAEGTVRWFNPERGHGFIVPDGGAGEVRVHYSEIQLNGYKTLAPGERVSFDVACGPEGVRAVTVTPLGEVRTPPSPGAGAAPSPGTGAASSSGAAGGAGAPKPIGVVRGILIGLLGLLMLGSAGAFVVVGMIQGEEIGAVFLLLALALGGLLAFVQRD